MDSGVSSLTHSGDAVSPRERDLERKLSDALAQVSHLQQQVSRFESESKQAQSDARSQEAHAAQQARELEDVRKKLDASRKEAKQWKQECETMQHRGLLPPDLADLMARVRDDAELARRFSLSAEWDDLKLLMSTVAVLSDEGNIKRLWDLYKKRCEDQCGPLGHNDKLLYGAALNWYNYKWPSKLLSSDCPAPDSAYNYEIHMRPAIGMTGETIAAVWLPGIPGLKLKTLVATR